ncbi:hypothetical protein JCM10599A_36700 [Paraburkholderia kururiensis]
MRTNETRLFNTGNNVAQRPGVDHRAPREQVVMLREAFGIGHDGTQPGILDDVRKALTRIRRVERHIGRA